MYENFTTKINAMKAILTLTDFLIYKSQVRYFQLMNFLNTYKYWILCSIAIISLVLAAGETFGWRELKN